VSTTDQQSQELSAALNRAIGQIDDYLGKRASRRRTLLGGWKGRHANDFNRQDFPRDMNALAAARDKLRAVQVAVDNYQPPQQQPPTTVQPANSR
jgi:hypothetical protein